MVRFALLFICAVVAVGQTPKPDQYSSIEGHVLNAVTGEPLAKAALLLMHTDSPQRPYDWIGSYAGVTDAAGKFTIDHIAPGHYRLSVTRSGFLTVEYGGRPSRPSGTVLDLASPQQLKDIGLSLTPQGVVSGRILDADGEPLERAQVQLLRSRYVNGRKVIATTATTYTNDLGEYRWAGLTAGRYYIYAEDFNSNPPTFVAPEAYVSVYYPGVTDVASAVPVEVTAGAQIRSGDIMLRKARTVTVRGRVVIELAGTRGIPSVRFSFKAGHDNSSASTFHTATARVNAAGQFEIRSLTPGSYNAWANIGKGGLSYGGSTHVDVAGTDIQGVVITIGDGVSINGRIRMEDNTSPDLQSATIVLEPGGPERINADRTFKIDHLDPVHYGITAGNLPDGYYTKNIRAGTVDATYAGIDLSSGAPGPIDIVLSAKAGVVSGTAQNPDTGQPFPGATVVLAPKEKERAELPAYYRSATTDQYGRFTFRSIVPGGYKVYGWEDVEPSAWMDPDFMKPLTDKGAPLSVAESGQANVQVNVIVARSTSVPH